MALGMDRKINMFSFIRSLFISVPPCPPDLPIWQHNRRFQCQKWYIRLARSCYYLLIPFRALSDWCKDRLTKQLRPENQHEPLHFYWTLHTKIVEDLHMKLYYTLHEEFFLNALREPDAQAGLLNQPGSVQLRGGAPSSSTYSLTDKTNLS
jgi:hypothetical protein